MKINTSNLIKRFRTYMLILAISLGFTAYLCFHNFAFLQPLKAPVKVFAQDGLPVLIFIMLFCAFCKVKVKEMKPKLWHFLLVLFQVGVSLGFALIIAYNPNSDYIITYESIIVCIITPTAASAAVLAGKLGGNESSLTTYTLICNIATAIAIPLIFPIFSDVIQGTFLDQFLVLLHKVFPVIVLPLFIAFFVKLFVKPLHQLIITKFKDFGFYLWGFTLTIISGRTFANIFNSDEENSYLWMLALVGLICTIVQFSIGKLLGHLEHQRITAGQALGQKNMVFGLWIALTYLSPTAAIAPGCYILWQNAVNAYQMWLREHNLNKWEKAGIKPYQE